MKFYYTGAIKYLAIQEDNVKSLGGYISSTEVESSLNKLFGDITNYTIWNTNNKEEYRCIVVKNDTLSTLNGLCCFFQYPNDDDSDSDSNPSPLMAQFKVASDTVTADDCGDLSTGQSTKSIYSKPNGLVFKSADGVQNVLALPSLNAGSYLAIWLQRTIKPSAKSPLTDQQYLDLLNKTTTLQTLEQIALTFRWA